MINEMISLSDNDLLLMAKAGNNKSFNLLIRRYLSAVYGSCLRFLNDQAAAEDAVQETFVKVWRNLKKIDPQKNFRAWVMEIAKNTCLDAIKSTRTVPMSAFEDIDGGNFIIDSLESAALSPSDYAEQTLLSRVLTNAISKLTPAYQKVLDLYYRDGLNFREISETLEEPIHTIKSRHRRAIINLRSILTNNT
jgi:RNA polymerase sigma-70 factor (ECF subfamily)